MVKKILFFLLPFAFGFLTHAFVFPDVLSNGITDVSNYVVPDPESKNTSQQDTNGQLTKITFDGKRFSRNNITVGFTRYIQIINDSEDELMWLTSNAPDLSTTRGYAHGEAVKTQFNEKGQFVVADKNNPAEKLVITVK